MIRPCGNPGGLVSWGAVPACPAIARIFRASAAALALLAVATPAAADARHVVLVTVDTLRRDHLTPYGYERDTSPAVAALARRGVVFDTAIAAETLTGPAHATMLTGLHPPQHGATLNGLPILAGVRTVAETLRDRGILTAGFISALPLQNEVSGLARGFAHYDENTDSLSPAAQTCERVRAWLPPAAERATFLFVHLFDPHNRYTPPEPFASRFPPQSAEMLKLPPSPMRRRLSGLDVPQEIAEYVRRYDGEIASADHCVGELLRLLRERGYDDRALVLFTADHGETLGERYWPFDHGTRVFDEQIRVPLILRMPGDEHAGLRVAGQVQQLDVTPTILEFFGIEPAAALPGRSLLRLGGTETDARAAFSLARPDPRRLAGLVPGYATTGLVRSIRRPPYKLIRYPIEQGHRDQLFDLAADAGESHDLAADRPEVARRLASELDDWETAVGLERVRPDADTLPPGTLEALRALGYNR